MPKINLKQKINFLIKKFIMKNNAGLIDEKPSVLLYEYEPVCGVSENSSIPESFMLEKHLIPDCRNQKTTGQCAAFTAANILQILNQEETGKRVQFSTTYIYGKHRPKSLRNMEGMYPSILLKKLCMLGSVPNETMPQLWEVPDAYDLVLAHPELDEIAEQTKINTYVSFVSADKDKRYAEIKKAMIQYNLPIFGVLKMGNYDHAVSLVGWDKNKWYYMNSWGTTVGAGGICWAKYDELKRAYLLLDAKNTPPFPFVDVADGHWANKAIKRCFGAGIINGIDETHFEPESVLTRAQICQVLYKLGIKFTEANGEFFKDPYTLVGYDDVRSDHWFYNAVRYCTAKSIIHEKRDNSFCPDAALTRAEFCSCIWNFIQEICNSNDMLKPNHVKMPFKDVFEIDKYYNEIQNCYSLGIINGVQEDKFCPDDSLNRAQLCQMIYKLIKQIEVFEN